MAKSKPTPPPVVRNKFTDLKAGISGLQDEIEAFVKRVPGRNKELQKLLDQAHSELGEARKKLSPDRATGKVVPIVKSTDFEKAVSSSVVKGPAEKYPLVDAYTPTTPEGWEGNSPVDWWYTQGLNRKVEDKDDVRWGLTDPDAEHRKGTPHGWVGGIAPDRFHGPTNSGESKDLESLQLQLKKYLSGRPFPKAEKGLDRFGVFFRLGKRPSIYDFWKVWVCLNLPSVDNGKTLSFVRSRLSRFQELEDQRAARGENIEALKKVVPSVNIKGQKIELRPQHLQTGGFEGGVSAKSTLAAIMGVSVKQIDLLLQWDIYPEIQRFSVKQGYPEMYKMLMHPHFFGSTQGRGARVKFRQTPSALGGEAVIEVDGSLGERLISRFNAGIRKEKMKAQPKIVPDTKMRNDTARRIRENVLFEVSKRLPPGVKVLSSDPSKYTITVMLDDYVKADLIGSIEGVKRVNLPKKVTHK